MARPHRASVARKAILGPKNPNRNVQIRNLAVSGTYGLGIPSPRSSRRWNFEISITGAVPRHGVINWEEFGEKFWWVVLLSQWSTKMPREFRPKFRPIFRPTLRPGFRPVIKICRHDFALGNISSKYGWRKTYRTTRPPDNFWTSRKERLVLSIFRSFTGKNRAATQRGVENVPNDGGFKTTFWEGCHSWGFPPPSFFHPPWRFYTFSLPWNVAIFSTFCGSFLTKLHRKAGEKGKQSTGENSKESSGDQTPKLQISVPCRDRMCPEKKKVSRDLGGICLGFLFPWGVTPQNT